MPDTVSYQLTENDWINSFKLSKKTKRALFYNLVAGPTAIFCAGIFATIIIRPFLDILSGDFGDVTRDGAYNITKIESLINPLSLDVDRTAVVLYVSYLVFLMGAIYINKNILTPYKTKKFLSDNDFLLLPRSVGIDDRSVSFQTIHGVCKFSWSDFKSVTSDGRVINLRTREDQLFVLPSRLDSMGFDTKMVEQRVKEAISAG